MKTAWVQLGRAGDVINILPLLWHDAMMGNEPHLIVCTPFAHAAKRCSYLTTVEWGGQFERVQPAVDYAIKNFDKVYVPQIYSHDYGSGIRTQESFAMESWAAVGMVDMWGKLPLVFDRPLSEFHLPFRNGEKIVLVSTAGHSSPFKKSNELKAELMTAQKSGYFTVIDIDQFPPMPSIADLLTLYRLADVLICTDSAPMHLAQADPGLQVISLITDRPTRWHGAPVRPNHWATFRYSQAEADVQRVVQEAIMAKRRCEKAQIVHVTSDYQRTEPSDKRHQKAAQSWTEVDAAQLRLPNSQLKRTSKKTIRDDRDLPFIKDMVDAAVDRLSVAGDDRDIVLLTNDDTIFVPALDRVIRDSVARAGAVYAGRMDFKDAILGASQWEILRGHFYPGADLFAFTVRWWRQHRDEYPDMILGAEAWDWIMRELIMLHHGAEIHGAIYHEIHDAHWNRGHNVRCPANVHNRTLARAWLNERGIPIRELARTI
jgi:hypothetical protein